jgi:hypothetical protein
LAKWQSNIRTQAIAMKQAVDTANIGILGVGTEPRMSLTYADITLSFGEKMD